jgi:hemerythrin superfamily protein
MNIIQILKRDHREVKSLFRRLEMSTKGRGRVTAQKVFSSLKNALDAHTLGEEEIVYPRLKEFEKTRDIILESYEEHRMVTQLLNDLAELSLEDETWMAKLSVRKEMVNHHVQEEEETLFPKVEKLLEKDDLEEIGAAFVARRDEFRDAGLEVSRSTRRRKAG